MTIRQILFRDSSPAQKAALAFALCLDHSTHKILNLVGPLSDGRSLASSLYRYISGISPDAVYLIGKDVHAPSRRCYRAKCLILVAECDDLSAPAVQAFLSRLLRRRHDLSLKTLVVTDQELTAFGHLHCLAPVCHAVSM